MLAVKDQIQAARSRWENDTEAGPPGRKSVGRSIYSVFGGVGGTLAASPAVGATGGLPFGFLSSLLSNTPVQLSSA